MASAASRMKVGDEFNPWRMFHGAWIPNWLLRRKDVNANAKLVYARFCQYGGEDGEVYPRVETLAEEVGCSEKGVRNAIKELEDLGLIKAEDRRETRQSSIYKFLIHEWILEALQVRPVNLDKRPANNTDRLEAATGKNYSSSAVKFTGQRPVNNAGLLRDSGEEIQVGRESRHCEPPSALAVSAEPASPLGEAAGPSPPTSSSPPTYNTPHEEKQNPPPAAGCEKLNPPPFDLGAVRARQAQEARARAEQAVARGEQKYDEAHRRKLARANAKERWRASVEDEIPPPEPERSPRGQLEYVWKKEWLAAFPDLPPAKKWGGKEYGQAQLLLDRYELVSVQTAFEYVIRNWQKLCARWFRKDPTKGGIAPSLGLVLRMHDAVVPEASVWEKHRDVVQEYDSFGDRYEERPAELRARYLEAQKELQALGL